MADTAIEWADVVWNPTTGCDRVSPGCDHCYALTMAKRLKGMGSAKYQRDGDPRTSGPGFGITEHASALDAPLRWRKPRKVFVNSMSDLFHDGVSDEFIARVFASMALAPQHTFQVLTKRHGRMEALLRRPTFEAQVRELVEHRDEVYTRTIANWPLPNVWGGVSVDNQRWADIRIPSLMRTPFAVRWISAEPLLGPVSLYTRYDDLSVHGGRLDWVVVGGESGPGARPMHPAWPRSLRDQCCRAGIPFLFKQWGGWSPIARTGDDGLMDLRGDITVADDGTVYQPGDLAYPDGPRYGDAIRAGHDRAQLTAMYPHPGHGGRELDGRTWDEYPTAREVAR